MREKIYINYIPVYRFETDDSIGYCLFEDSNVSSVIHLSPQDTRIEEYKLVLDYIVELTGNLNTYKHGIRARIEPDYIKH